MHTLRKIAPAIIALTFLAAASDAIIFHRANTTKLLSAAGGAIVSRGFFEPAIALLTALALLGLIIILHRLAHSVGSFAHYLWAAPGQSYDGLELKDRITFENDLRANRIQVITVVVQALGGIAILIGIYFAWANLRTTQKGQTETLRITYEGQITERFTKAIEQLGAADNNGKPRLELRLGGIYALERIARDSENDHWPIMEVLATYVRENAPIKKTEDKQLGSDGAPTADIQAILTVIGRRGRTFKKGEDERLNLAGTNLAGANLYGAELAGADLRSADLAHANLMSANLREANLSRAELAGVTLTFADLAGADLAGANLTGAHMRDVTLRGASLLGANLRNAYLLGTTDLYGAVLMGADLTGLDLRFAIGLTQFQVDSARGGNYTRLPPGVVMPESWKHQTAAPTASVPKSP